MKDVLVLCYHAVSDRWPAPLALPAERIERQVADLLRRGFVATTFRDAVLDPPAARTVAVTFDDAFRSVFLQARPVLESLGVPGTLFVPTALIGGAGPMAWPGTDRWLGTPYEDELTPMSWGEVAELSEIGWELGSHTRTHPKLPTLSPDALRDEVEGSRADLEERLGVRCESIAYPYGEYNAAVVAATREAGYSAGGGLAGQVSDPGMMLCPRVGIYKKDSMPRFRAKTSPRFRHLQTTRFWSLRTLVRRVR
jgi:peptidoglycan/xylan/chitin deacetylase (PgdA/CDA1 family)